MNETYEEEWNDWSALAGYKTITSADSLGTSSTSCAAPTAGSTSATEAAAPATLWAGWLRRVSTSIVRCAARPSWAAATGTAATTAGMRAAS